MFVRKPEATWWGVVGTRLGVLAIVGHLLLGVLAATTSVAAAASDTEGEAGVLNELVEICSQLGIGSGAGTDGEPLSAGEHYCAWCAFGKTLAVLPSAVVAPPTARPASSLRPTGELSAVTPAPYRLGSPRGPPNALSA